MAAVETAEVGAALTIPIVGCWTYTWQEVFEKYVARNLCLVLDMLAGDGLSITVRHMKFPTHKCYRNIFLCFLRNWRKDNHAAMRLFHDFESSVYLRY
jgi:hypothetical protein